MTDEEMAELYANEYGFGSDFNNITSQEANQAIEQAFLAGLKQIKWHNLRSDPCDLPPLHTIVLNENCDKVVYVGNKWEEYSENYEKSAEADTPIAWCEAIKYGCDKTYYEE